MPYQFLLFKTIIYYYLMESNQPKLFIIGHKDHVDKILNKLPNKNKLYDNYLYDIKEPFTEYGFSLQKEYNIGEFRVIVCPENIYKYDKDIFKNNYFKNITAVIICDFYNYDYYPNLLDTNERIRIFFDYDTKYYYENCIGSNDSLYDFGETDWITKIYDYLDIPFAVNNDALVLDICCIL